KCGLYLLELSHLGPSQNQVEIGMGNKIATLGYDIGIACPSDFNASDDIPNVFKVYLGLKNADHLAGETFNGNHRCHVWFSILLEINWTKRGHTSLCLLKD